MSVLINGVTKKSIAEKKGIKPGDVLVSVNSHEINDVLDYDFYTDSEKLHIVVSENGKSKKRFSAVSASRCMRWTFFLKWRNT